MRWTVGTAWKGRPPLIEGPFYTGRHGNVWHGLWHVRQWHSWRSAWGMAPDGGLIDQVQDHGDGLYTVPSVDLVGKFYAVKHYTLPPDGYLWICDCPAGERAGYVCKHAMAAYLYFLRERLHWRLKPPEKGD